MTDKNEDVEGQTGTSSNRADDNAAYARALQRVRARTSRFVEIMTLSTFLFEVPSEKLVIKVSVEDEDFRIFVLKVLVELLVDMARARHRVVWVSG